jgi:small GTP-binding protein
MVSRKIILTGSFGVGKTSLFNRFVYNQFDEKYLTTIGVKVNKKQLTIDEQEVSLLLWDIAGEISQDKVPVSYFLGATGIFYVFDLSRPSTFKNIITDLAYLEKIVPDAVVKIIANKKDLLEEAQLEDVKKLLAPTKWDAMTSAKTGENVEEILLDLAKAIL